MAYELTVDFLGMVVVVDEPGAGRLSVGCLDEPGHVHTIHGLDGDGLACIAPLRLRAPGRQVLQAADGDRAVLVANGRLFDVAAVAPPRTAEVIAGRFVTWFELRGGRLEALPAHVGDALSTWRMPGTDGTFHLTDRLRYRATVDADVVMVDRVGLAAHGGAIQAIVTAVDHDYGRRDPALEAGLPLTEFVHFYSLTQGYGPIPVAAPQAAGIDPGMPICPVGYVRL
ncbi:MAG: hypothetical protein AB7U83_14615 [Vicinamibacterales bacterium]